MYETANAGTAISMNPSNLCSKKLRISSFHANGSVSLGLDWSDSKWVEVEKLSVPLFRLSMVVDVVALSWKAKNNTQSADNKRNPLMNKKRILRKC